MNTEQNYVGGGNFATTPPQTGQNGLQSSSKPDQRHEHLNPQNDTRLARLERQKSGLLEVVGELFAEAPASAYTDLLSSMWSGYVNGQITDNDSNRSHKHNISGSQLDDTFSLMRLMHFIAALSESLAAIKRLEDQGVNE